MSSPPFTPPPGEFMLPTYGDVNGVPAAAMHTDIWGDPDTGCVRLGTPRAFKQAALWPPGHGVRFAPLRIYDEHRTRLWSERDPARWIGGGESTVSVSRLPEGCRTGDKAWWVVLH